jgi:uncharacterized membrane protein (Fun14 family)
MSSVESLGRTVAVMGGGFFAGILVRYALKKVIKIVVIIVGLFLAGLAYLQYYQIANINWNKVQAVSEHVIQHFQIQLCRFQIVSTNMLLQQLR